jgi:hypothetical protein
MSILIEEIKKYFRGVFLENKEKLINRLLINLIITIQLKGV